MNHHTELLKRMNRITAEEKNMYEQLRYAWLCMEATAERMGYSEYYTGRAIAYCKEYHAYVRTLSFLAMEREAEAQRLARLESARQHGTMIVSTAPVMEAGRPFYKWMNGQTIGDVI